MSAAVRCVPRRCGQRAMSQLLAKYLRAVVLVVLVLQTSLTVLLLRWGRISR